MFESQLCHVLRAEPWAKDLASLSLSFPTYKQEAAGRRAWLMRAEEKVFMVSPKAETQCFKVYLEDHQHQNPCLECRSQAASRDIDCVVWGLDLGICILLEFDNP